MKQSHDLLVALLALQRQHADPMKLAAAYVRHRHDPSVRLIDLLQRESLVTAEQCQAMMEEHVRILAKNAWNEDGVIAELIAPVTPANLRSFLDGVLLGDGAESADRYERLQLAGEGGLGRVWKCRDRLLDRVVALKEILPKNRESADIVRRFEREARITAKLEHPNIVPVYDVQHAGQDLTYAMRLIGGRTLAQAIADFHAASANNRNKQLDFRNLLAVFLDVGNAVIYAHAQGVIHRDLKPANVVLGEFGEVILLDWGLAKRLTTPEDRPANDVVSASESSADATGVAGTIAFMAPEQASGATEEIGQATDVFGLGAILFTILTNEPPTVRGLNESPRETLERVANGTIRRVRDVRPRASSAIDAICAKAMAARPADRYPSAKELCLDVARWQADQPVLAYPEPWTARVRRWIAQHPLGAQAIASFFVVSMCALVILAGARVITQAAIDTVTRIIGRRIGESTRVVIEKQLQANILVLRNASRLSSLQELIHADAADDRTQIDIWSKRAAADFRTLLESRPMLLELAYVPADAATTPVVVTRSVELPIDKNLILNDQTPHHGFAADIFRRLPKFDYRIDERIILPPGEKTPRAVPVLVFGLPVRDGADRAAGTAVLAFDVYHLSGLSHTPFEVDHAFIYLANAKGEFQLEGEFIDSKLRPRPPHGRMQDRFPDAYAVLAEHPEQSLIRTTWKDDQVELLAFEPFRFDPDNEGELSYFIIRRRQVEVEQTLRRIWALTFEVAAISVFLAAVFTWLITLFLTHTDRAGAWS